MQTRVKRHFKIKLLQAVNALTFVSLIVLIDPINARVPSLLWQNGVLYTAETFTDLTGVSNRPDDTTIFLKNIYQYGYMFSDATVRDMGADQWEVRARVREIANLKTNDYTTGLRHAWVENKSPVAEHLYVSAGRMFSPFFLPMQRLDGGVVRFTPEKKSPWAVGVEGGQIPAETAAYLTQDMPRNHAGSFLNYEDAGGNNFKVQYDTGFETGMSQQHKGEVTAGKLIKFDQLVWFMRGAFQFTMPHSVLDYAQAETGVTIAESQTHSVSAMDAETLFVVSPGVFELQKFSEYRYNYTWHKPDSKWRMGFSAGYNDMSGLPGYTVMGRLMYRKAFFRFDSFELSGVSRQRAIFNQNQAILAYGIYPWYYLGFRIYAGGEAVTFRGNDTSNLQYGLAVNGDGFGTFNYNVMLESRHYLQGYMEMHLEASMFHVLNFTFGSREAQP